MVKYIDKVQSHEEPKLTETNGVTTIPYNIEQVTKIDEQTEIEETYYSYSLGIFESSKDIAESMLAKKIKNAKLSEAKTYLADTDWVIVKINEMQLEGVDTTSLMEKYKEELVNRTHYRNLINSLEE